MLYVIVCWLLLSLLAAALVLPALMTYQRTDIDQTERA